ncbi:hypothetical protein J3Q64DRAFT_1757416 [Phycomyces blakesleeanus]|uniref:Uncharacterized protein n=2 Tax=Phycomyces blakesleeanus TaxID=4837 RepID=A0A163BGS8_PHYB8|nr:hypothetical protein PHYBLDRAFT_80396 [Phycomyces blakesleeanus NRRL 1555(-)]OAD81491.1 hypothetical protein PHYBLDRAFT_80396 [Phycomyces blakesleeanus NRRL 1555(-)]|eukprot:XP_018299531.1 hypothetical protein PHYBLDRAFT_80396 [Phycomyces blakesleeanus NRRL 1555(-)]
MLRPAKIFASFHQLRHYIHNRVSELVHPIVKVAPTPIQWKPPSGPPTAVSGVPAPHTTGTTNTTTATASIKLLLANQEHQKLLFVLQQQFPIVKIFSAPFHRPCPVSFTRATTQQNLGLYYQTQFRRTITSFSSGTHSGTPVTFSCGFPRTATVGYARVPFAARQFSTAKSPLMVFQGPTTTTTTNTTAQQANTVFSHVSSRIFSPIGSKLGPAKDENDPNDKAKSDSQDNSTSGSGSVFKNSINGLNGRSKSVKEHYHQKEPLEAYNRLARHEIKGIYDLVFSPVQKHAAGLVRRESVSRIRHCPPAPQKSFTPYDYICHQDFTVQSTGLAKRFLHPRQCQRTKEPPDPRHVFRGTDPPDHHHNQQQQQQNHHRNNNYNNRNYNYSVYISIPLDSIQMTDWEVESLSVSIKSIASLCSHYQHLLSLLHRLYRHADFESQLQGSELKLYFPSRVLQIDDSTEFKINRNRNSTNINSNINPNYSHQNSRHTLVDIARHWLRSVDLDPEDNNARFVVKQTDPQKEKEKEKEEEVYDETYFQQQEKEYDHGDYHRYDKKAMGPEYFRGIQQFLDHVDDLIETGPAFGPSFGQH